MREERGVRFRTHMGDRVWRILLVYQRAMLLKRPHVNDGKKRTDEPHRRNFTEREPIEKKKAMGWWFYGF